MEDLISVICTLNGEDTKREHAFDAIIFTTYALKSSAATTMCEPLLP